ncbi:MAG: rRNA adenine dimethyltransferase family protein [Patescibacteria group bacterium]|jgi:16S rRNA (adenine1518-N6/adenine1519-N6)-dimethyltransferase
MPFAKKSYGQHFLRDQSVLEKIVAAAEIQPEDVVVEIGPGTGALTEHLRLPLSPLFQPPHLGLSPSGERNSHLILIEADADLIPALEHKFPEAKIIQADAAQVDYGEAVGVGTKPWILVGNLPYNAGNAILMHALQAKYPPKRLVVMLQKEVGERMLGKPGSMSVLSVAVQLYAHVDKVCAVPPGAFNPPPKVDSMVLTLVPFSSTIDREAVIAVAKAGFANRRKQLHKNLAESGISTSEKVKDVLKSFGLSELARAEELTVEQWIELKERL